MKSVILHADGRRTDLAGTVAPATYTELENLHCPRRSPVLWCGGCGSSIYIRHGSTRRDELFGAHHHRGDCQASLVIRKSLMSDEHKRQAEYHALAAQQAGHTADLEVRTTGHTRVDVVINGTTGIEVQRSALTKTAAADRTARSVAAGLTTVSWFTDLTTAPQWAGHVPGYRTTLTGAPWQTLPQLGTAGAAGLQIVEAVRCGTRKPCPHRKPCGRFIPWLSAWGGLYVDDVVEGLATGTIRPVRIGTVRLLSTASIGLYEELAGTRLGYDPGQPRALLLPPSDRLECELEPVSPGDVPPAVREWLEREAARVRSEREERDRQEREEADRAARQAREDRERLDARELRVTAYEDLVRAAAAARERRQQEDREQEERRIAAEYDQLALPAKQAPPEPAARRPRPGPRRRPRSPGGLCAGGCGARPAAGAEYCQACRLLAKMHGTDSTDRKRDTDERNDAP